LSSVQGKPLACENIDPASLGSTLLVAAWVLRFGQRKTRQIDAVFSVDFKMFLPFVAGTQ